MITVMGAAGHTGRKVDELLLHVGEKVHMLGRLGSKLAQLPPLNPTVGKPFVATVSALMIMIGFLVLLGCETTVISANPRQVIVESSMLDAKKSQQLAEAECGKYERYARMALKASNTDPNYTFDCVE